MIVDAGDARLSMWLNGQKVDEMKVVVGKAESPTPMMAAYIKYADVNPYWNVPPDLVKNLIGPRIIAQGVSYLTDREYQVMTSYSEDSKVLDPHDVDWNAVVAGTKEVRLRRLPSPANSMGMMKFMLPNYFGIYLMILLRKIISPRMNCGLATAAFGLRITSGLRNSCSSATSRMARIRRSRSMSDPSANPGLHDLSDGSSRPPTRSPIPGRPLRPRCASD